MWLWWILVVALASISGLSACGYSGAPKNVSPCTFYAPKDQAHMYGPLPSEEFYRSFSSPLVVEFGETAVLTMEMKNVSARGQTIGWELGPDVRVTTPQCEMVWYAPFFGHMLAGSDLYFRPGEVMRFGGEWSLTDNSGEMVPPGDYFAHVVIRAEYDPPGPEPRTKDTRHVAFKRIRITEEHLRAARPAYPPTPVDPSVCGAPVSRLYVRSVMNKQSEVLEEWRSASIEVLYASLLDKNRRPTGAHGIRVVVHQWRAEEAEEAGEMVKLEWLPECLDGVPVQLVVRLGV